MSLTLSHHFSIGLSSSLWDLSRWIDQQCQPPPSQPVSHHLNRCHFGHRLLDCGYSCVHLPAGLAQPGLQHCGWSHFHLHTGHQLHAVCASGKKKTVHGMHAYQKALQALEKCSISSFTFVSAYDIETFNISKIEATLGKGWEVVVRHSHLIIGYFIWKPAFITDSQSVMQKLYLQADTLIRDACMT